jgi:hypothetical protein
MPLLKTKALPVSDVPNCESWVGFRPLSPATIPPPLKSLRPNAPHDPPVKPVEELSDLGSLVVMAPSPQHRIEFLDQLRSSAARVAW